MRVEALERLIVELELARGPAIDVGCGRGVLTAHLAGRLRPIRGIDVVASAIDVGRGLFPDLDLRVGSVNQVVETGDRFGVVVCSEVLEHVPVGDQRPFLASVGALLEGGGALLLTTPRGELRSAWSRTTAVDQPEENWLTEPELSELIADAGLRVVARSRAGVYPLKLWHKPLVVGPVRRAIRSLPPLRRLHDRLGVYQVVAIKRAEDAAID